ncbi:MAG TPA: M23 family metallopeptidase [Thermoanaerobaculia bacterium]|nr:M23 family metallopeptidase [Thermoanaerobaculia bacterium]
MAERERGQSRGGTGTGARGEPGGGFGSAALRSLGLLAIGVLLGCDGSSPTDPGGGGKCGPYPNQAASPYVLPYPPGEAYLVSQGNCSLGTHLLGTRDGHAYDFRMAIGSTVVAARSGVVEELEERFFDRNGVTEESNYVLVRHDDGTAAVYFHLTQDGVLVFLGMPVIQGQPIGRSGQTGRAGISPHLHFGVLGPGGLTIPVTFRNTSAHPDGLQEGVIYPAL